MVCGNCNIKCYTGFGLYIKDAAKDFYGNTNAATDHVKDISIDEKVALSIVVVGIIITGVYPQPVFDLTSDVANWILMKLT